jgi:hypothetical protein
VARSDEGRLSGLYHTANDVTTAFAEVGVLRENALVTETCGLKIPSNSWHSHVPGAPSRDWHLNVKGLEGNTSLRFCEANLGGQPQCIGMLLTYEDGHQECLGQLRFDKHISQEVAVDAIKLSQYYVEIKPYVRWRFRTSAPVCDWCQLASQGAICWWFGSKGNSIVFTL